MSIVNKSKDEIFKLGYEAAKSGRHIDYDPFRNRDLNTKEMIEKNDAWIKGYKSYGNKDKI